MQEHPGAVAEDHAVDGLAEGLQGGAKGAEARRVNLEDAPARLGLVGRKDFFNVEGGVLEVPADFGADKGAGEGVLGWCVLIDEVGGRERVEILQSRRLVFRGCRRLDGSCERDTAEWNSFGEYARAVEERGGYFPARVGVLYKVREFGGYGRADSGEGVRLC